uniref:Phosphatidylinositide phosphatase SAC2 n=1 Tax=Geotrypetes seraphini TaxID=260995 RepID=A0A6P8RBQ1_GEOSA|nr:phosphatidylinositide phosphatase SAC2 [Geotrypetes seraphini]
MAARSSPPPSRGRSVGRARPPDGRGSSEVEGARARRLRGSPRVASPRPPFPVASRPPPGDGSGVVRRGARAATMELFQAKDHYILQSGEKALWCSRKDGGVEARAATDLLLAWNPVCLGLVEGVIGKVQLHSDLPWWLLLIRQKALIGKLPGDHEIYKIIKIAVIPLSEAEPQDLELELCKKHHFGINKTEKITQSPDESKFLLKTLTQIKSNVSAPNKKKVKENKEKEKLEKRLLEELFKMFMDSDSFYYSLTYDLTNSVQRQNTSVKNNISLWQRVDDRFFWNKHMIQDVINLNDSQVDSWILPMIQGFVQIEELVVNYNELSDDEKSSPETPPQEPTCVDDIHPRFLVAIISRRSRHRAGMRYKRRGVDKNGNVANCVETEQLIHVHNHTLSFVQTRGSVPVFWSQVGYRYNPRPRLDKGEEETRPYFCAHFEEELKIYKKQVLINLVDQTGREKIIGDAYLRQVLLLNNPNLTYVSFDFHEHWKSSKPHEDIMGIRSKNQKLGLNSTGIAQGKNFLISKFSSLNQKVKQTKSSVNLGSNLRKLGNFTKPEEVKSFLKPNLKVNLWKSDSSLENPGGDTKNFAESDIEISSDSDSYHSDDYLANAKSDEDGLLADAGETDYVLPSCGILASAPRLRSRSQSISSAEIHVPTEIYITHCDSDPVTNGSESEEKPSEQGNLLMDFNTPVVAYCHQFAHDAQTKSANPMETKSTGQEIHQELTVASSNIVEASAAAMLGKAEDQPPRPSWLDVPFADCDSQTLPSSTSSLKSPGSASSALEPGPAEHSAAPSPAGSDSGRAVSPFAKIRNSMAQVANMTQAGLTQGINFAVAKVQKSPEPETENLGEDKLKAMFSQCQTRIIQI